MGQMKHFKKFGIIERSDDPETEPIKYCPKCFELHGLKKRLGPRQYLGEIPSDANEWIQCNVDGRGCGAVFGKYEAKQETALADFTQVGSDPFDSGKSIIGIGNLDKGKTSDLQRRIRRIKKEISEEPDPDIKAELRRGNTVTIVEDNNMYDRKVKKNYSDSDWN